MKNINLLIAAAVLICMSANLFISTSVTAQNLVPNGDFETFSSCPNTLTGPDACNHEISKATGWDTPAAALTAGTSDYYNACWPGAGSSSACLACNGTSCWSVGVPSNFNGDQAALSGNAYAGFITYDFWSEYREYIQIQLTPPAGLVAGTTYKVSINVVSSPSSVIRYTTDGIGAYLSATAPAQTGSNVMVVPAQFISSTVVGSAGWTFLSGTFVAAGGEKWLTIGGFKNDVTITAVNNGTFGTFQRSYYYIDDVCVATLASGTCISSLPIQLLSFTGNCTENNSVNITWSTATEANNDYFTIERATSPNPSKGGGLNWEAAGTVKGAGNSSTVRSYEFIDNQVLPFGEDLGGVVYYRLRQTDFDGKTEVFNNQQIAVDITECAVQVFPNPAGNTLNIPYSAEQDGEVTLQVYDVIGKLVKEKTTAAVKGHNKFTLDLTTIAQGMYILKVNNGTVKRNEKFVKE